MVAGWWWQGGGGRAVVVGRWWQAVVLGAVVGSAGVYDFDSGGVMLV